MQEYLENSKYINWQHPDITAKATALTRGLNTDESIANTCFEFVRDKIYHSWDYQQNPVTCKASDVLKHSTGYCYAKSHLLAALLRANGIPAGLCYQRLTVEGEAAPFCLHGLNAVFLEKHGWYRIDARGNKDGISASFCPPLEKLAYPITADGEADLPEIWSQPLKVVIQSLETGKDYLDVYNDLPDVQLINKG